MNVSYSPAALYRWVVWLKATHTKQGHDSVAEERKEQGKLPQRKVCVWPSMASRPCVVQQVGHAFYTRSYCYYLMGVPFDHLCLPRHSFVNVVGAKTIAEVNGLTKRNPDMTVTIAGLMKQNAETTAWMRIPT